MDTRNWGGEGEMYGESNMETYITICKTDSQWDFAVWTSLVAQMVKASAYNVGDLGSIPGSGRSPGEGNGNLLQYSCLENPMEPGRLQSMGWQESDRTEQLSSQHTHTSSTMYHCSLLKVTQLLVIHPYLHIPENHFFPENNP